MVGMMLLADRMAVSILMPAQAQAAVFVAVDMMPETKNDGDQATDDCNLADVGDDSRPEVIGLASDDFMHRHDMIR